MPVPRMYNIHTHIFNFKCVPQGFLTNYLPRGLVSILGPLMRVGPIAWAFSRVLRIIPIEMAKKYRSFVSVGTRNTPQNVFEDMVTCYPDRNAGFVVLSMNFDHMGGGKAPANYETQLELLKDVKRKYPDKCYPFVAIDPRMGNADDVLNFVKSFFEPDLQGFYGIKMYPSLGFYPSDPRLEKMYAYAEKNRIPIITHCTKHGAFYASKKIPPDLLIYNSFNHTEVTRKRHEQKFYQELLQKDPEHACDAFLDPVNYYDVLDKFPSLKLCFAHYGGDDEINRYFEPGHVDGNRAEGYADTTSWYHVIRDFMKDSRFKEVCADISFTLYDTGVKSKVVNAIRDDLKDLAIGGRILFGTDYFMTLQHKEELNLCNEFRDKLGDMALWENLVYYNNKKFLESAFYKIIP